MKPKLLIITDLGLLKAYRLDHTPQGTPHLDLLEELQLEDAHQRLNDRLTDLAGRNAGTAQRGGATTMADRHNLELEFKRRLVKQLASKIEALVCQHGQNGCWFAANKQLNAMLMSELPRTTSDRIEVNVARDLTKTDPKRLLEHFPAAISGSGS